MDREKLREILVQLGSYQGRSIGVDGAIDAILKLCNECPLKSGGSSRLIKMDDDKRGRNIQRMEEDVDRVFSNKEAEKRKELREIIEGLYHYQLWYLLAALYIEEELKEMIMKCSPDAIEIALKETKLWDEALRKKNG